MNNTTATHAWPSWVATVERDPEGNTILCSGAARTIQITDTSSATPATIGLCIRRVGSVLVGATFCLLVAVTVNGVMFP